MAKRKTTRKKKVRKKSRKNKLVTSSLLKAFVGIAVVLLLVVLAGVLIHFLIPPEKPLRPRSAAEKSIPATQKPIAKIPEFEIYPKKEIPPRCFCVSISNRCASESRAPLVMKSRVITLGTTLARMRTMST